MEFLLYLTNMLTHISIVCVFKSIVHVENTFIRYQKEAKLTDQLYKNVTRVTIVNQTNFKEHNVIDMAVL